MIAEAAAAIWFDANEQPERRCASRYELRFTELFNAGHSYVFPCDAHGNVDIDRLTERARVNYFYVRTTIGRDFCAPVTRRTS
jgi:hypothetical protein